MTGSDEQRPAPLCRHCGYDESANLHRLKSLRRSHTFVPPAPESLPPQDDARDVDEFIDLAMGRTPPAESLLVGADSARAEAERREREGAR